MTSAFTRSDLVILVAILALAVGVRAWAEDVLLEPQHQGDIVFLTGGVGDREQAALHEEAQEYDFALTVTRPDGAYLAHVDVSLEDASGNTVLRTTMNGPILLAELPPGRYKLEVGEPDRVTERRVVDVPQKGRGHVDLFVALPRDTGRDTSERVPGGA